MIPVNRTYAPLQAFVDELARCGLRWAVTSPGSRNAPLLLSLAAEERIRCVSVLDERSAGFVALGIAKATGAPVVVTCTSGTAAANLLPALVEAREARVPLVALTGDRPPELRDVGAGQSIDQVKLYGAAVKWFVEVGNHEPGRESAVHHRALACRAWATAAGGRPGPVHLNFALREPLAPVPEALDPEQWRGRADGAPWTRVHREPAAAGGEAIDDLSRDLARIARGVIVCGPPHEPSAPGPVTRLAAATGWPILAEPASGLRCGPHDRSAVISHYDALLRSERFAERMAPEVVLRSGDMPTSKPLRAWLARSRQIVLDPHAGWHEPTRRAELIVVAGRDAACSELARLREGAARADAGWLGAWRDADAAVSPALAEVADPFEAKLYAALAGVVEAGSTVWISSSMPIRDVETFFPSIPAPVTFLANRGANGIDGVVSSAAGAAIASSGRCFLLTGELALLHDLSGLLTVARHDIELTIVCVNNGGGGIFDFLPVAEHADPHAYEEHVATPSGVDLAAVAAMAGLVYSRVSTVGELQAAAARPGLIEARTDRRRNVELHRELFARIAAAHE